MNPHPLPICTIQSFFISILFLLHMRYHILPIDLY